MEMMIMMEEIRQLREELDNLKKRFDAHTHPVSIEWRGYELGRSLKLDDEYHYFATERTYD